MPVRTGSAMSEQSVKPSAALMRNLFLFGFSGWRVFTSETMMDGQQLFRCYAETDSEAAFAELTKCYINFVYSTALRLVDGDSHRAEDVTQTVFIDLARKASSLSSGVMLGGWLHRHTCFTAANVMRGERRRAVREREAAERNVMDENNQPRDIANIDAVLDRAINELSEEDRTAVILRFFEQCDFRSIGERLGLSQDTARMRVNRALQKLEHLLKRRGVTATAAAIAVAASAAVSNAAPVTLTQSIVAAALTATGTSGATTVGLMKAIGMTTLQKAVVTVALIAAAGVAVFEASQASHVRNELLVARQQAAVSAQELKAFREQRDDTAKQLAMLRGENERLTRNASEVARLRNEVTRLQNGVNSKRQTTPAENSDDPTWVAAHELYERATLLKQRFKDWPKETPELGFLSERDWLEEAGKSAVDSDVACRQAMANLRYNAKAKFANAINTALTEYLGDHEKQLPTALSQLQPYLGPPAAGCLSRYELAQPGWVKPPQPGSPGSESAGTWALIEKGTFTADGRATFDGQTLEDPEYDMHIVIYHGGHYGYGPVKPKQ